MENTKVETPANTESKLTQLNTGLLILDIQKEMEESHYAVIDRVTYGHSVVKKRQSYLADLQRVLGELKLTAQLLEEVNAAKQTKSGTFEPEELINYYAGIFLGHVHQIKDKILKLVDYMAVEGPLAKPYDEPKEAKVSKVLKKHSDMVDKVGIRALLEEWQESDSPIGTILKKRTQHHHRLSGLALNKDFLNVKMSKTVMGPGAINQLSEYGKQYMTKLNLESFNKLKSDVVTKQQRSIKLIEENLNAIAEKLIAYYKVPIDPVVIAQIANDYNSYLASLRITNEAKEDLLPADIKKLTNQFLDQTKKLNGQVVSVYLVGSCGRGEFIPGTSDLNLYLITKNYSKEFPTEKGVSLKILTEEEFLSEKHAKDRFICWSDGILLHGKKFEFDSKDFPKPGTLLCLLLNKGVIEEIESIKGQVATLDKPTSLQLRMYSLKATKVMIHYGFGVAMANKPFYSASMKKKIAHIKEVFPRNKRIILLEKIYYNGAIKQTDFPIIIDAFLADTKKNYQKLLYIEKDILED